MKNRRKIIVILTVSAAIFLTILAQRDVRQMPQDSTIVPAVNENDTVTFDDAELEELDFFDFDEHEEDFQISKPDIQILDPRQELLLQRELQRHENEIKKINLMRRRAREMLKNSDDMRARELERHYKAVKELQNR